MKMHTMVRLLGVCAIVAAFQANGQTPETTGSLFVQAEPEGCTVTYDGRLADIPPVTISGLDPGRHLLVVSKPGYREYRRTVEIEAGQRAALSVKLEPLQGLVLIHSTPTAAAVEIDGAAHGRTPLLLAELPLDSYRVRISSSGFIPQEIDLLIPDRTPIRKTVQLVSDSAVLTIDSQPAGARVLLGGILRGTTPCTLERVPVGENTLSVTLDGYRDHVRTINLSAGTTERILVPLEPIPAELTVVSIPEKARIYLDNQFRGEAPVTISNLAPGEYRLRAELSGFDPLARTVTLNRAGNVTEEFRLQANAGAFELTTEPAGVAVTIDGERYGTTTAGEGETDRISNVFRVELLPSGTHDVQLNRKGYFSETFTIEIDRNQTVALHRKLARRFIPNCEVRTATDIYRGVLVEVDPLGNIRLEVRPGIIKTIPAADVVSRKPLRADDDQ